MRSLFYILILSVGLLSFLSGCGGKAEKRFEESQEDAADIEAAMMQGREAAKIFITRKWTDTADLQKNLLEARARRCVYDTAGRRESAAAFDSGFVSTIRTVRPDIANHLK